LLRIYRPRKGKVLTEEKNVRSERDYTQQSLAKWGGGGGGGGGGGTSAIERGEVKEVNSRDIAPDSLGTSEKCEDKSFLEDIGKRGKEEMLSNPAGKPEEGKESQREV